MHYIVYGIPTTYFYLIVCWLPNEGKDIQTQSTCTVKVNCVKTEMVRYEAGHTQRRY